jgi:uncharacterized protein (TIGR00369 family)
VIDIPLRALGRRAEEVESLGFDRFWLPDERLTRNFYTGLTVCALHTESVGLGVAVTNPYSRNVALTAAAAALVAIYVVRWLAESPGEIARSDFVPLQVAAVIVRSGDAAHLYDPVRQAPVYAAVTQSNHPGALFYIHAPLAGALVVPFSLAGLDGAFRLWGLWQLACLIAAAVIAARSAPPRWHGRAVTGLAAAVALAVPSTMLMLLEGQDVGVPALLVACAYLAMRRHRPALAGGALAVAALAGKPHLFLGIAVWILFWGDRRLIAGAVVGAATATLASLAAVGPAGVAGFAATLLDTALGCAVNSVMPAGKVFTTLEMKINFTHAVTRQTGTLTCSATIVHAGSRTATAEGRITDAGGKVYAHGSATFILYRDNTREEP